MVLRAGCILAISGSPQLEYVRRKDSNMVSESYVTINHSNHSDKKSPISQTITNEQAGVDSKY